MRRLVVLSIRDSRLAICRFLRLVLFVAAFACGCVDDFRRVDQAIQERCNAAGTRVGEDPRWREAYGPDGQAEGGPDVLVSGLLSLEESRRIALSASPDVHAVRARIEQALARIDEARSLYFPTLTLNHGSSRTFQTPRSRNTFSIPISQPLPDIPANLQDVNFSTILELLSMPFFGRADSGPITRSFSQHTTTLAATWTLFDGFAREAQLLAAKYASGAARMALVDSQRLLVQAVDEAYYQVQLGWEQRRIAQADLDFSREQLDVTRKWLEAGRATPGDVKNFEVRVHNAETDLVAARGLTDKARTVLAELMGIDDAKLPDELEVSPLAEEVEAELAVPNVDEWIERALKARPDLAAKEFELQSKTQEVRLAKAQFSPGVFASGAYGFDRTSNMAYGEGDQASSGAIEMRWQLFTGGFRTSQVRRTEAERVEAAAELRRWKQRAVSEVRQAVIDLVDAQERVRLQRLNLASATENRRIVQAEYAAGKSTLVRLNEAQRDLIAAEASLASSRIRLRQAWSALRAAAAVWPVGPTTEFAPA